MGTIYPEIKSENDNIQMESVQMQIINQTLNTHSYLYVEVKL